MPFLDWLFGHGPAEQQPQAQPQAGEVAAARPPRPGARGNADFEAAAAGHLAPVPPLPARDPAIDNENGPPRPVDPADQPDSNALPFFLWAIALHHPLTAVAGLGFAGGMVLYGTAMAGGRLVRYATRAGRHPGDQQGNAVADAERRLADLINAHRAEARVDAQAFLQHLGPPAAQRRVGADPARQGAFLHRELIAQHQAARQGARLEGDVEDMPDALIPGRIAEQALPAFQAVQNEPNVPLAAAPAEDPAPLAEDTTTLAAQVQPEDPHEMIERLQQQLKARDDEVKRLQAECDSLKDRLEAAGVERQQKPSMSSTLPSANNVDLTGPMLAQTRPINNVDPDDIPGPTPRSTSVSDDTGAAANAPPTASASEPDFKVADIHTAMRELSERHRREAAADMEEPLSPDSTATWDEDVTTREDDAPVNGAQQETGAVINDASSMATRGQDAVPEASSESATTIADAQRAVDHSTTSDASATTARAKGKGKGKKQPSVPASATSSDDSGDTVMHRSEGALEAAHLRQAIAESLQPQASSREPAQGEAGPSTYTGARPADEPASSSPPSQPRAQDTGMRRSFTFRDDITVPLSQGWHTMPILLTFASQANAEQSGLGWGYQRRQSASQTYTTTARLFITHDVHLIEFDGVCWRVALEGDEYVLQGRYYPGATE